MVVVPLYGILEGYGVEEVENLFLQGQICFSGGE
jgi:hypothetical protein